MNILRLFIFGLIVFQSSMSFTGCSNENIPGLEDEVYETTPLDINVTNQLISKSGGVVTSTSFADGAQIGLFATKTEDDSNYDTNYSNVQYKARTTISQMWESSSPIQLTDTHATIYAYYPYKFGSFNMEEIPIDVTENSDVMYATPVPDVYKDDPFATLTMKHALAVIRFSISKGDYSGSGVLSRILIKSASLAPSGTLNIKTGAVTPSNSGSWINYGKIGSVSLSSSTPVVVEQLVVPVSNSGTLSVMFILDGKLFEAVCSSSFTTYSANVYTFSVQFSDSGLKSTGNSNGSTCTVRYVSESNEW